MSVTYSVELLEATINKQVERIEALEAALRKIAATSYMQDRALSDIVNAALAPKDDQ